MGEGGLCRRGGRRLFAGYRFVDSRVHRNGEWEGGRCAHGLGQASGAGWLAGLL